MRSDVANITQAEAMRRLEKTGLSEAERLALIAKMAKVRDGAREKVSASAVAKVIAEKSVEPVKPAKRSIRPLSRRHREAFSRYDKVQRVMEQVRAIAAR
jgi:hypothetical protein